MESLGLDPRIIDAVRALGIETFTEPQERAIPRILAGENLLLVAPTGIGKTEAALLPILDRLVREKPEPTSCLYITPLRALNRDMLRRMTFFADRLGIRVAVRHGDTTPQARAASCNASGPPPGSGPRTRSRRSAAAWIGGSRSSASGSPRGSASESRCPRPRKGTPRSRNGFESSRVKPRPFAAVTN